jgi:two-component system KDP operon response regulator KdpE
MLSSHVPDLVVLDLGLPDMDGEEFIRITRRSSMIPIIVLSARSDEKDKVSALDLGANDYITKPFGTGELLARVRAALRNTRHSAEEGRLPGGKFLLKELEIDYDARQVFLKGEEIHFTQTEYNVLALLSENRGKMMTYAAIIKAIWGGYAQEGSIKKLQVNMANIRKKLGDKPGEANYIANELGVGYRLNE